MRKQKQGETMKKERNALEKLYGSTLTPLQVTDYYQIYLRDLKKVEREKCDSNVYYKKDRETLIKKIDNLLSAATEVYG